MEASTRMSNKRQSYRIFHAENSRSISKIEFWGQSILVFSYALVILEKSPHVRRYTFLLIQKSSKRTTFMALSIHEPKVYSIIE